MAKCRFTSSIAALLVISSLTKFSKELYKILSSNVDVGNVHLASRGTVWQFTGEL